LAAEIFAAGFPGFAAGRFAVTLRAGILPAVRVATGRRETDFFATGCFVAGFRAPDARLVTGFLAAAVLRVLALRNVTFDDPAFAFVVLAAGLTVLAVARLTLTNPRPGCRPFEVFAFARPVGWLR
jgi:hypothetical protein